MVRTSSHNDQSAGGQGSELPVARATEGKAASSVRWRATSGIGWLPAEASGRELLMHGFGHRATNIYISLLWTIA